MNEKDMMREFYEAKKIREAANGHGKLAIYQRVIDKYELGDI